MYLHGYPELVLGLRVLFEVDAVELGEVRMRRQVPEDLELLLDLLHYLVDRLHDLHRYHVTCKTFVRLEPIQTGICLSDSISDSKKWVEYPLLAMTANPSAIVKRSVSIYPFSFERSPHFFGQNLRKPWHF